MKERKEKETSHEGLRQISRECDNRREREMVSLLVERPERYR